MATNAKQSMSLEMRQQVEIAAFVMPPIAVGDKVRWYQFGVRDESRVASATVCRVLARSIDLQVDGAMYRNAVKHADDPRLKISSEQRDSGCWDYTINHNKQQAFEHEMRQRIEDLERRMNARESDSPVAEPSNKGAPMTILWEQRRAVQALTGQEDWSRLSKTQCEAILGTPSDASTESTGG